MKSFLKDLLMDCVTHALQEFSLGFDIEGEI